MRSQHHFKTTINLLCLEGAFAIAYDTWLGSAYLSGLAGEMGVDVVFVTILASLPWIGSAGQLLSLGLAAKTASLRKYTIRLAWLGRSLWLIPILAAALWGSRSISTNTPFPARSWFLVVALTAMATALIGNSSGISWSSWMRGLIPVHFQARFFGLRQRYIMFTLIVANIVAGIILNWRFNNLQIGYFVLACLGLLAATASTMLLSRVPDCPNLGVQDSHHTSILTPLEDPAFRKILAYAATFNGAIFFCAPYFAYFYTHDCAIPLSQVVIWAGIANAGSFLASTFWAKRSDSSPSGHLNTLALCGYAAALSPLVYVLPSPQTIRYIAPLEFFINGISWSGVLIANSTLLFRACPPGRNAQYFSVYAAATGVAGAIGVFLGGQAVQWLQPYGGFRALWVVGAGLRILTLWCLLPQLKTLYSERTTATTTIEVTAIAQPSLEASLPLTISIGGTDVKSLSK